MKDIIAKILSISTNIDEIRKKYNTKDQNLPDKENASPLELITKLYQLVTFVWSIELD